MLFRKLPTTFVSRRFISRALESGELANGEVKFSIHKSGLAQIILNRPKALNSLTLPMVQAMHKTLKAWAFDPKIAMVLVSGAGPKAFCAGGDILAATDKTNRQYGKDFFFAEYLNDHITHTFPKPYVAAIHGVCMGGGVGISVHSKFRVAEPKTLFAMPETGIGLFPDVGGVHALTQMPQHLGTFLGLTGHRLKGADVLHSGIATHFISSSEEHAQLADMLDDLGDKSVSGVEAFLDSKTPKDLAPFSLADKLSTIERTFSGDSIPEILSALERETCDFSRKNLATLKAVSPTSLVISLHHLRHCPSSLAETLKIDYRLAQRCCDDADFREGVRALLVDKDKNPKWTPVDWSDRKAIEAIISKYFSSLDGQPGFQEFQIPRDEL